MNVNLNKPITYFEGPIDSYLYNNSISLNSVHNKPPFETNQTQYFFDYDDAGIKKLTNLLKENKTVFLWELFFKDVNILVEKGYKEKIDFNDVFTYCKQNRLQIDFQKYFSNDPMDLFLL